MELLILAPFCFVGAFILLGFGLVLFVNSQRSQPYSAREMAQAEAGASDFFSHAMPTLLPWRPDALADLAARWEGTRSGFLIGEYKGMVRSLSYPDRASRLACYLCLKGRRGFLRLRAPGREMRLDIAAGEAHVVSDEQPLGSIRLNEGTIFDREGQPIGRYHRYRGWRWQMGSVPTSSRYGPLELRGRTVAEVNDALVRGSGPFVADSARRPLVRNLAPNLKPEEERWLLALVGLELYHDAIRARRRHRVH